MTINKMATDEPEVDDDEAFRQSLIQLGRSSLWVRCNTVATIVLLSVAIAALSPPQTFGSFSSFQPDVALFVRALLVLLLLFNGYVFFQQRHLNVVRRRLAQQMEITVKQRMRADKFYGLAILDPLTKLYNRRFGEERLLEEMTRAERNGDPLAVILLDLDYFKEINDQFGHAAGDLVLKEFSRRLKKAIRACDVPVRIGGDEFLIILPECSRENVEIILSRLTPFPMVVNGRKISVRCSRGRAQYQVSDTPEALLGRADKALYDEKASRPSTETRPPATSEWAALSAAAEELTSEIER